MSDGRANPTTIVQLKGPTASSLYDEMEELEKTVLENTIVNCIRRLEAAVKDGEAVVGSESQHAERVVDGLRADIGALEAEVKETEETVQSRDSASQRMEKTLTAKLNDLQSEVKQKEQTLECRNREVSDLQSKIAGLGKQISQLEAAIQQAKAEIAGEARRDRRRRTRQEVDHQRPRAEPYRQNPRLGK
jgi:DNA repair exonuclease SbcCD ATPase subunit